MTNFNNTDSTIYQSTSSSQKSSDRYLPNSHKSSVISCSKVPPVSSIQHSDSFSTLNSNQSISLDNVPISSSKQESNIQQSLHSAKTSEMSAYETISATSQKSIPNSTTVNDSSSIGKTASSNSNYNISQTNHELDFGSDESNRKENGNNISESSQPIISHINGSQDSLIHSMPSDKVHEQLYDQPQDDYPQFRSALSYTEVRDYAYPEFHYLHYGAVQQRPESDLSNESDFDDNGEYYDDYEDDLNNNKYTDNPQDYNNDTNANPAYSVLPTAPQSSSLQSSAAASSSRHPHLEGIRTTEEGYDGEGSPYPDSYTMDGGPPWREDPDLASPVVTMHSVGDRISREFEFSVASADEIHGRAVAVFDFVPENDNEAPLKVGQVIWVSYRHGQGWLVAEDPATGETGLVPEEYVRMLPSSSSTSNPTSNETPSS